MRMRKKKNLVPRMERCSAYLISDPAALRGRWRSLKPDAAELRLELGCGKGRFTVETAQAEPDVLFIAVERVPDAMVVGMERAQTAQLHNVFFVDIDADQLPALFAPGEVDRIYINFCDPWPGKGHAKRRLTHGNFLKLYRQVLREGGQIHFKTDNVPLFDFSVEEIPQFGFTLSEVTRNLHENGPQGVMTDYEAKFYQDGLPINRLVATMGPYVPSLPDQIDALTRRYLDAFAPNVSDRDIGRHVLSGGNYLWHLFSYELVPAMEGEAARQALSAVEDPEVCLFYREYPPEGVPLLQTISREQALREDEIPGTDWYLTDPSFTWTYARTHEADCGPYFCRRNCD